MTTLDLRRTSARDLALACGVLYNPGARTMLRVFNGKGGLCMGSDMPSQVQRLFQDVRDFGGQ